MFKLEYTFYNVRKLIEWLKEKNYNAGSPEAFSEWLYNFFNEGNSVTVHGEEYDYQYCMELI